MSPSAWVVRHARLPARRGAALDVAAGRGRHARLLAGLGYAVTAVDRDVTAVRDIPGVEAVEADLEDGSPPPFAGRAFDAVVVTCYLHRPLLPAIVDAVAGGGVLVYETYARGHERFGKPSNPDFLLEPGELLEAVRGALRVVAYEDREVAWPRPARIQRLAAMRPQHGDSGIPSGSA